MEEKGNDVMVRWIGIPLAIVLGDGAVKKCAEEKLADGKTKEIFGGHIRLQLLHNPGVALGALAKDRALVLVINSALLGVTAGEFARLLKGEKETAAKVGLALLLGGGTSNLIDRLKRGYVTDYFSINAGERFRKLRNVVFNCSDFCVFAGVLCYVFGKRKHL
ncbi:MAG: signal peptidase II [Lachnospiraceae bacterium]